MRCAPLVVAVAMAVGLPCRAQLQPEFALDQPVLCGVKSFSPSVDYDGQSYFVIWSDARRDTNYTYSEVYGAHVSAAGVLSEPVDLPLVVGPGPGRHDPRVAFVSDTHLIVWSNYPAAGCSF